MLYSNEVIHLYDPETGKATDELQKEVLDEELRIVLEEGQALESLKNTAGWAVLEKFLNSAIEVYTDKLVISTDFDQTRRLQEAVKSYGNIGRFVDQKIAEAKSIDINRTPGNLGQSTGGK